MKKYTIIALLLCTTIDLQAQTWSEWFRQRKTQIKYLKEQIAALKVYGDHTLKGYQIAKEGLTAISRIKEGDLFQHQDYFASLARVNPRIKTYWRVAAMISLGQEVQQLYQKLKREASESGLFTDKELAYMNSVYTDLLEGCTDLMEQLIMLITDDAYEMKDDERLRRIDSLYAYMQDRYTFARHFESETKKMALQRLKEKREVNTGRLLYGTH